VFDDEEMVASFFSDDLDQSVAIIERGGIGVDEDRAMLITFSNSNVQISHIVQVQLALLFLHLKPLGIITVQWVDPAKRFHCKIEDQLEMGDTT
jgi:hypothetical protein